MLLFGVDLRLDAADQHAYGNGIETSLLDDYVGVFLRWLDELLVHGLDCVVYCEMTDCMVRPARIRRAGCGGRGGCRVRIDIYLDVHQVPEFLVLEDQNTIDDDYLRRFDQHGFGRSVVIDERIDRMFDRNVVFQRADVFDEHICIERLRVVVIEFRALFVRQFGMGFVVVVVAERDYLFLLESSCNRFTSVLLPDPVPPATPMTVTFIIPDLWFFFILRFLRAITA